VYVVTGAAGFIGSNLVKLLNSYGHDKIVCVDDLSTAKTSNLSGLKYYDFMTPIEFLDSNYKITTLFHIGANSKTSETDWTSIYNDNVKYTRHLLNMDWQSFVFASSASIYGDNKTTIELPENESPKNLYAATKQMCDNMIRHKIDKGQHVQSWRFFNVYGNNEFHKIDVNQASPYTNFKHQATTTGKIKLFDNSKEVFRDFICVTDVVKIIYEQSKTSKSFVCNLGTGNTYSFQQWGELIARTYDANIEYIPIPDNIKQGYQKYTQSNNNFLKTLIGTDYKFVTPEKFVKDNL
jgi:ADP-L-glycero-D-manno-heptose 6-epimerase